MDSREMEVFLKVADYRSLTRVADEFGMTQPAVSATIKRLEEFAGAPLFVRQGRQLVLNQAGECFYQTASTVCTNLSHIKESFAVNYSRREELVLAVGVQSDWLLRRLDAFSISHSNVSVTLRSVIGAVPQSRSLWLADFMVLFQYEIREEDHMVIDIQDSLFAIVPGGHPLAEEEFVPLNSLRKENFVFVRSPSGDGYERCYNACVDTGFLPRISLITDSNTAKYACIQSGCGIGLVYNNECATAARLQGCVLIPVRSVLGRRPICLAWKENRLSDTGRSFLEFLRNAK